MVVAPGRGGRGAGALPIGGRPRPAALRLPPYRPGRSAEQAAAEHGLISAVKLASNEAPYGPLPSVAAALAGMTASLNRYPDPRCERLRRRLAETASAPHDSVIVGAGSAALLFQLASAYLDPGDEVVFGWPSFEAYPIVAAVAGGRAVTVGLRDGALEVGALAGAVTERTKLVVVANPNNPTGTALAHEQVERLALALPGSVVLVLDEAYREFRPPGDHDPAPLALALPNVIVLRTFSKAYGLAGLRVGYGIGAPALVELVSRVAVPFAVSAAAQAAALASLDAPAELAERVARVVNERDRVLAELRQQGFDAPGTSANFVWLPVGAAAGPLALDLERAGVVTRPVEGHGVRVTVGTFEENQRFLRALAEVRRGPLNRLG